MIFTIFRKEIRCYRASNPYSHTLTLFAASTLLTVFEIMLVGAAFGALWVVGNNWTTSQQQTRQQAALLVGETSQQLEAAGAGRVVAGHANFTDANRASPELLGIAIDNPKSAATDKHATPVSSDPFRPNAATLESVHGGKETGAVSTERDALKVSAYQAALFDSLYDDAKQTQIEKGSTVFVVTQIGEWIKVTTADTQETGFIHSSLVIAD